ncbi:MAG: ATP-binding cassette domain-containing protein [Polyangiaceae bacterium]
MGAPQARWGELRCAKGEIVGIAGVEGNGQRELVHAVAGLIPNAHGLVKVAGRQMPFKLGEADAVRMRRPVLRVVHEDRHVEGLLLDAPVSDNLVLGQLEGLAPGAERAAVARRIDSFGVAPSDPARRAGELSGGNQQKVVVARALDGFLHEGAPPGSAVVLAQPTRGVDVGAAAVIHAAIGRAAAAGLGVLIVSADLAELRLVCHRLLVLHKGRIVAEVSPSAPEEKIGRAMLGLEAA